MGLPGAARRRRRAAQPRWIAIRGIAIGALVAVGMVAGVAGADPPTPPFVPADAPWLTTVNYYRAMAGVAPVVEDPALSVGAALHSCYMLDNGISHDETPGLPGYTDAGRAAGNASNVAVSSVFSQPARAHIELWMSGPFHAIGVLRPNLAAVGFGTCDKTGTPTWHSAATLDVIHRLAPSQPLTRPILFPGDGTTTSLDRFRTESPSPLDSCPGWSAPAGLPALAMMPESTAGAVASISGEGGPLETCTVTGANSTGIAKSILDGNNSVVAVPRSPLSPGRYTVSVRTDARTVNWSFRVDPQALYGITPTPQAVPLPGDFGLRPLTPARVVDTRIALGAVAFAAGRQQRVQITGRGGVAAGATAAVVNVTSTESTGSGFVTMWNCGARPMASSLNFVAGQTVANSATVALDAGGGACVFNYAPTQLVIDVSGYYAGSATARYSPVAPVRVADTRIPLGPIGRLAAGQTMVLPVTGTAGVPADAAAVSINVTADNPSADGFVTVYPCDQPRPGASSLNPARGTSTANLVTSAVSRRGTVCLFSSESTDLIVDVFGSFGSAGGRFSATVPFRATDTRELFNDTLNAGSGGFPIAAGQVLEIPLAGGRGIPVNATAVLANITAVGASGPGWVAAWPCTGARPGISNVNYRAADPIANSAPLALSPRGTVCVTSYTTAHVIIDVNGWWT